MQTRDPINTEDENGGALADAYQLMRKGDQLSADETKYLDLLVSRIEDFEEKEYPMGETSNPQVALRELVREHRLKQTDLLDIFGSQGTVSQVLNGRRSISKAQARRLSERFHLPIDIFI